MVLGLGTLLELKFNRYTTTHSRENEREGVRTKKRHREWTTLNWYCCPFREIARRNLDHG